MNDMVDKLGWWESIPTDYYEGVVKTMTFQGQHAGSPEEGAFRVRLRECASTRPKNYPAAQWSNPLPTGNATDSKNSTMVGPSTTQ